MSLNNITPNFQINGTGIAPPARHRWIFPSDKGRSGSGQTLYEPYFTYEMEWTRLRPEEFKVIYDLWRTNYQSGTFLVNLPDPTLDDYIFKQYTGVTIDQPEVNSYDYGFISDVKLTLRRITI